MKMKLAVLVVLVAVVGICIVPPPEKAVGMTQRAAFQKLWDHIETQGYTSAQFAVVTKDQVQNDLGLTDNQITELRYFWKGMHEIIMQKLLEKEKLAEAVALKDIVKDARPGIIDWQNENVQEAFLDLAYLTLGGDPNAIP